MRIFFIIFCYLCSFLSECFAQAAPQLLERFLGSDASQRYLIQLPSGYRADKKYTVFIAIHWYTGTAEQQVNEWKFYANKEKYILLCPQFADGYQLFQQNEDKKLIEIIKELEQEFHVGRGMVFLVGYSGGAQFAHRFAFRHCAYIRAVCVLAAGEYDSLPFSSQARKVKYFVAAGEEDPRFKSTKRFYLGLKNNGYDVVFKSFPGVGHTLHSSIKGEVIDFLDGLDR